MTAAPAPTSVAPAPAAGPSPSPGTRAALAAVHLYRGVTSARVSPCRFTPTCSAYAVEVFERHGLRRGLPLVLRRLARCRPGGPFGSDPVPD